MILISSNTLIIIFGSIFGIEAVMRNTLYIYVCFLLIPICMQAQEDDDEAYTDEFGYEYMIIEGDTIPRQFIGLEEVYLLGQIKFDNADERRKYLILKRRTLKVYPYARLAADRLYVLNRRLDSIPTKRKRNVYTKRIQKYVEGEFTDELKKLTRSEGRILIKLIHRQTGMTTFELVKELRTGWRAFWYNTTASIYDISLKSEFRPYEDIEDYYIEDILQRAFQEGVLEVQHPAFPIDYFELSDYWKKQKSAVGE